MRSIIEKHLGSVAHSEFQANCLFTIRLRETQAAREKSNCDFAISNSLGLV